MGWLFSKHLTDLWGIAVPVTTPAAVRARIAATHNEVLLRPEYAERLADPAMEPLALAPEQTTVFIRREIDKWRKLAAAANVRMD